MPKTYRSLTEQEICILRNAGCTCEDWSSIHVREGFMPERIENVNFRGPIRLGLFQESIHPFGTRDIRSGLRDVTLCHVEVGDHAAIRRCGLIANMSIGDAACLLDTRQITVDKSTCFGEGVDVTVINETGGREVRIFSDLSSQVAYLQAFYRYRPGLIQSLMDLIDRDVDVHRSAVGSIGASACVSSCGVIRNVKIGSHARVDGAQYLENGTINSGPEHPSTIGPGVIGRHFIVSQGAEVTDHSCLNSCFIGQAVSMRQYSADHSLFFSNSEVYLGESCSVFAGPFTVSHHKASLLIAGYMSFFNAGSGTNQSNHMYRLGPSYQGTLERGCKTASGAYICWPAQIGAFSFIKGRLYNSPDTVDLPFSYVMQHDNREVIYPGAVLGGIGLMRDRDKWPGRDKRRAPIIRDALTLEVFSPWTVCAMKRGVNRLETLLQQTASGPLSWNGLRISRSAAERGCTLYHWAIDRFFGDMVLDILGKPNEDEWDRVKDLLSIQGVHGGGSWVDIAGLIAPQSAIEALLTHIEQGRFANIVEVNQAFGRLLEDYRIFVWQWILDELKVRFDHEPLQPGDLTDVLERYCQASERLHHHAIKDASKEYIPESAIGFGRDGDRKAFEYDFEAVRGRMDDHLFIQRMNQTFQRRMDRATEWIRILQR